MPEDENGDAPKGFEAVVEPNPEDPKPPAGVLPNPVWPSGEDVLPNVLLLAPLALEFACRLANGDEFRLWLPNAPPPTVAGLNALSDWVLAPPPKGLDCWPNGLLVLELALPNMLFEVVDVATGALMSIGGIRGFGLEVGF